MYNNWIWSHSAVPINGSYNEGDCPKSDTRHSPHSECWGRERWGEAGKRPVQQVAREGTYSVDGESWNEDRGQALPQESV